MPEAEKVNILGVPVAAHTMDTILSTIEELIEKPGCAVAYAVNAHSMNLTYRSPEYFASLKRADLVYVDGASLQLAAWFLGKRLPEKLTTTDLWPRLCEIAATKQYRFFLLGGEEGLMEEAKDIAVKHYPGLQVVGAHHGYFGGEDDEVIGLINDSSADILWVGMGDPRQVLWSEAARQRLNAGLVITCGGMFKVVTGKLGRVDEKWRRRGFEWLIRLFQEPKYTWRRYLIGLPAFGLRVFAQKVFRHRSRL